MTSIRGPHIGPTAVCAAVCVLYSALCIPHSAFAQQVRWRTDYAAARREAADKGRPLLIDFGTANCFWCRQLDLRTFRVPAVVAVLNEQFIPLKIDADREPALTRALNIQSFPTLVIASPAGKVLDAHAGFLESDPFQALLARALNRVNAPAGTATASDTPAWMEDEYQKAERAAARSEYASAVRLLKRVVEKDQQLGVQAKAASLLKDVESRAAARLASARRLEEAGRLAEAAEAASEVVRRFEGTAAAAEGQTLLASLGKRSEAKVGERERKARALLTQARDDFAAGHFLVCLDRCESVLAEFGDLPVASAASELAERVKADPGRMQKVCDRLPDRHGMLYLAMAEAKLREGQPQQAAFYLERVIQAFPNTRHAELAQARLSQIQGPPPLPSAKGDQP